VDVFKNSFKGEEHKHLKNFHVITAPLTLNFIESIVARKEKLNKKSGRHEATFTDDGFALGMAYILRLLGQDEDFDSLHWFDAVNAHIEKKTNEINAMKAAVSQKKGPEKEEDIQHVQITSKRLASLRLEFEMLFYSFTGARIFFRDPNEKSGPVTGVEGKVSNKEGQPEEKKDAAPAAAAPAAPSADGIPAAPPADAPPMAPPFDAPPM